VLKGVNACRRLCSLLSRAKLAEMPSSQRLEGHALGAVLVAPHIRAAEKV
jgi:hypothetical protein